MKAKPVFCWPFSDPLGRSSHVYVVDVRVHDAAQRLLAVHLLHGEDVGVEEPHIAAEALVIHGGAGDGRVRPRVGRLAVLGVEVLQVPRGEPQRPLGCGSGAPLGGHHAKGSVVGPPPPG